MSSNYRQYAKLLTDYCLSVKKGDKVYVRSTYLAEPLLQELASTIVKAGGHPHFNLGFMEQERCMMEHVQDHQLSYQDPLMEMVMKDFDCYLFVRAPFNTREPVVQLNKEQQGLKQTASRAIMKRYHERTASGEMRRSLCQFPTLASAQEANMSLSEYEQFVFNACNVLEEDPIAAWNAVHDEQQDIVDVLNKCTKVEYKGKNIDISFNTKDRIWINSDGKTNMPSGEVFTAPVEDSVNGTVTFTYPSIYQGELVEEVTLEVKNGEIVHWDASRGKNVLDKVFSIEGARRFGEAAIGTNRKIQQITNNILFDEKIGGSIHMAVGQAYLHCGGKNQSPVHWDLITDMKEDGEIYADDELIYKKGEFKIK